jgi:hypothetical protein
MAEARTAASKSLTACNPETAPERHLAAQVTSFSLHAQEALSQAATPDTPLTKSYVSAAAPSASAQSSSAPPLCNAVQTS